MAAATGGVHTTITEADQLAPAVLAAVRTVTVIVSLSSDCPELLSVSFTPVSRIAVSGSIVDFTDTFTAASVAPEMTIRPNTDLLVSGEPVPRVVETNQIFIEAPAPAFTGLRPIDRPRVGPTRCKVRAADCRDPTHGPRRVW